MQEGDGEPGDALGTALPGLGYQERPLNPRVWLFGKVLFGYFSDRVAFTLHQVERVTYFFLSSSAKNGNM